MGLIVDNKLKENLVVTNRLGDRMIRTKRVLGKRY